MSHRGPDDAGHYVAPGIGLGMRRLAIIDLSGGHQPMSNEDGTLWIVFNGEIYNYIELREQFLSHSHRFSSQSDTEVVLHLFEQYGPDCVNYLNGMFAFAIWNTRTQELFLARDRVGVKPLYYAIASGTLLFASEIKSLLQHPAVRTERDLEAVDEFLTYGYTLTPRTLFRGIFRLPEAHVAMWKSGRLAIRRYWDVRFSVGSQKRDDEYRDEFLALLRDSVRLRLRSDVPVGVLLSGGIDSSAVTALLSEGLPKVQTFSIGFEGHAGYSSELAYARQVADHFRTDHHEVTLSDAAFLDAIPHCIYHMDEPVADGASIPLYTVSGLASRHVKVVLSGEGADELLGGYAIYHYMLLLEQYRRIPGGVRLLTDALLGAIPKWGRKFRKYTDLATLPLPQRYSGPRLYDRAQVGALYSDAFRSQLPQNDRHGAHHALWADSDACDTLSGMLQADLKSWLPNDLLIKADRMTMATSIELRVPFLDYRLIEFTAQVPSRLKINGLERKHLLKRAMTRLLPREIIHRSKLGFPTPLARLLRGHGGSYAQDILLGATALGRGYFKPACVRRFVDDHRFESHDHHEILWRLIVLEEWHRRFVDQDAASKASVA